MELKPFILNENRIGVDGEYRRRASDGGGRPDNALFYNIFLDYNNEYLIIVGHELLSYNNFLPLQVFFNDEQLESEAINGRQNVTDSSYYIKFKLTKKPKRENAVRVETREKISIAYTILENTYEYGKRILTTTQKDNELTWIEDWANYYHNKYNIEQVIIYDDRSHNQEELIDYFKNTFVKIIKCVELTDGSKGYRPLRQPGIQVAALNNTLFQFLRKDAYLFNFDIDEMLMVEPNTLDGLLERYESCILNQYVVPFTTNKKKYSFSDFKLKKENFETWINRTGGEVPSGAKYIISRTSAEKLWAHAFILKGGTGGPNRFISSASVEGFEKIGYFLHYRGITCNWKKKYGWDRIKSKTDLKHPMIPIDMTSITKYI